MSLMTETTIAPTRRPARAKRPVRRRARTKAEQRAETSEQILDTAEYLFSKRGLYGVTLRYVANHVRIHQRW